MAKSIKHQDKLRKLSELETNIATIGPVRVCFDQEFKIGIGCGGTAVYVGLHEDGSEVAVKRVLINNSKHLNANNNEKEILSLLSVKKSPHIVNYRYFKYEDPFSYLILDLCEETLEDYVKAHDEEHLKRHGPVIIREILTGLSALHGGEEKILHLDLKPQNILVDSEGHMRLSDFGISRILNKEQTTLETGQIGTRGWIAAESLAKQGSTPRFKRKSDIQVTGMISFYILTKEKHPFGDIHYRVPNIIEGKSVNLNQLSDSLAKDFVAKMISQKIEDRPYADEALQHPYLQIKPDNTADPELCIGKKPAKPKANVVDIRKRVEDPLLPEDKRSLEHVSSEEASGLSLKVRNSLKELNYAENDYILIASKVATKHRKSANLTFLRSIPWIAVFDLFDPNSRKDGLHYICNEMNDSARVTVKELGDFNEIQTGEDMSTRDTTWILRSQLMHDGEWICTSKDALYRALSTYKKCCPTGKIHLVFLAMSDESLQEMVDVIESSFSIIGEDASKNITIISETKEIHEAIVKFSRQSIRKRVANCSIPGCSLEILRSNVKTILGPINFHEPGAMTELPYRNDTCRPVLNKTLNSLTDLEVYSSKPFLSSCGPDVERARENFYKGGVVNQLNLSNNHDISRTQAKKLSSLLDDRLERLSKPLEGSNDVENVTILYESGSGATTLCRRILWEKKSSNRCAVVKAITQETDYQIEVLHTTLFENDLSLAPPVLILVDNVAEQDFGQLQDKIFGRNVKCVLLNTVPIAKSSKTTGTDNLELRQLDATEIGKVKKLLRNTPSEDEKRREAAENVLDREKRFIWLGLELFGRQYTAVKQRISYHIKQVISRNLEDESQGSYMMILRFCCLLDYYSKGRLIFPHPCTTDILLDDKRSSSLQELHDRFDGLLLDAINESDIFRGWRPAHSLVGELVREEMDLLVTTKELLLNMNKKRAYVEKYLINNVVTICLDREKKIDANVNSNNSSDLVLETSVDDDDVISGGLEVRTPFSLLLKDVMDSQSDAMTGIAKALDVLLTLNQNVNTSQHKARSLQQIARLIAYEIGMKKIPIEDPQIARVYELVGLNHLSELHVPTKGFEVAHLVIDEAIAVQSSHVHHLVTKGAIFKTELQELKESFSGEMKEITTLIEKAITTCKEGIMVYDAVLGKSCQDFYNGYLPATVGKIQTVIRVLEIFKKLPYFVNHFLGSDESFKTYMSDGVHPVELKKTLNDSDLNYLLSLRRIALQLLNDLFQEIKLRRTRTYKNREIHELKNMKNRALVLRRQFYYVTRLDRTTGGIDDPSYQEDIVNDILSKENETPFSSWKNLSASSVAMIHQKLSDAISKTQVSNIGMLMCARALLLLQTKPSIGEFADFVTLWLKSYPQSVWAHLFNYMVHFPIPNGSLKTDVLLAKNSIALLNSHTSKGNRRSGAEYLLGKGKGLDAIIRPCELSENRQDMNKTKFWKSKTVAGRLERLRGTKTRKGVIRYSEFEIFFDNERYPKDSRDTLWFCLGFTVNGPYAYDPIQEDEYRRLNEPCSAWQSVKLSPRPVPLSSEIQPGEAALNAKARLASRPKSKNVSSSSILLSENKSSLAKLPISSTHTDVVPVPKEVFKSGHDPYKPSTSSHESWKNLPALEIICRGEGGINIVFSPKSIDSQGRIHHGTPVRGSQKSTECRSHLSKPIPKRCTFSHSWAGDTFQFVCTTCTSDGKDICERKEQHRKCIHNLGPYRDSQGNTWTTFCYKNKRSVLLSSKKD